MWWVLTEAGLDVAEEEGGVCGVEAGDLWHDGDRDSRSFKRCACSFDLLDVALAPVVSILSLPGTLAPHPHSFFLEWIPKIRTRQPGNEYVVTCHVIHPSHLPAVSVVQDGRRRTSPEPPYLCQTLPPAISLSQQFHLLFPSLFLGPCSSPHCSRFPLCIPQSPSQAPHFPPPPSFIRFNPS